MKHALSRIAPMLIALIVTIWIAVIFFSAMGYNPTHIKWDFENTAQIGDSFGVLSMIMAAFAAYYAYATYQSAKAETRIVARRAAEPSFLNLLQTRFVMMENITRGGGQIVALGARSNIERGQVAMNWAAGELWHRLLEYQSYQDRKRVYDDFISESIGGLTNYHRYVYHIIAFAERQFSEIAPNAPMEKADPSYNYIQLLRAQFSDEEMQLMAFNGLYGAGNPKLKHYIERYALFNNMPEVDIVHFDLPDVFLPSAFGLLVSDRPGVVREWGGEQPSAG